MSFFYVRKHMWTLDLLSQFVICCSLLLCYTVCCSLLVCYSALCNKLHRWCNNLLEVNKQKKYNLVSGTSRHIKGHAALETSYFVFISTQFTIFCHISYIPCSVQFKLDSIYSEWYFTLSRLFRAWIQAHPWAPDIS